MNPFDLVQEVIRRTSQFNFHDWLLTFACIILASYALLISRRT